MRLRYIAVIFVAGLYFALVLDSTIAAYLTASVCIIAYGLRKIEGQLIRLNAKTNELAIEPVKEDVSVLDELRALLEEVEPTENPFKDRVIAFLNKFDGRIIPPPPMPQDDPSRCKSCDGVKTMDRLYTCPDVGCPQPDFSGRN